MTTQTTTVRATAGGGLLRATAITLVASIVINLIIQAIAVALLNPDPAFLPLASWGPVVFFTTIGVLGAALVYWLLKRFTRNPARIFTILASIVLVLSFIPDLALGAAGPTGPMPGANWPNAIALMLMHIAPGLLAIRLLPRS